MNVDFEGNVPSEFTGAMGGSVIDYKQGKALRMNGLGTILQTQPILEGYSNFMIEADVLQTNCQATTVGVFSIGVNSYQSVYTDRLCYIDTLKYTPSTGVYGGENVLIRDRLANSYSKKTADASKYIYSDVQTSETGLLDKATRESAPFKMQMILSDGDLIGSIYDSNGNLVQRTNTPLSVNNYSYEELQNQMEGIVFSTHSSDIIIDNIKVYSISTIKNLKFDVSSGLEVNKWSDFTVYGEDSRGSRVDIDNSLLNFNYESSAVEIDNGRIKLLQAGEQSIKAFYSESVLDNGVFGATNIMGMDVTNIDNILVETQSDSMFKNSIIGYNVYAQMGSERIQITDYTLTGNGVNLSNKTITGTTSGDNTLTLQAYGITTTKHIYVSEYENLALNISKTTLQVGETAVLYPKRLINGTWQTLPSGEYAFNYNPDNFSITGLNVTLNSCGSYEIILISDNMQTRLTVIGTEPLNGVVIQEEFSSNLPSSSLMKYAGNDVITLDGNNVYCLDNKTTDLFGSSTWTNYKIEGKINILNACIDEDQYVSSFEIRPRKIVASDNIPGGQRGISFVYRTAHNDGGYMRIATTEGQNVNIDDGDWHDFSIVAQGGQCFFKIDDVEMCYYGAFVSSGYFDFVANNCKVALDDIVVTRIRTASVGASENITAIVPNNTVNAYETYDLKSLIAIKTDTTDNYIAPSAISWTITSGDTVAEVLRNTTLRMNDNVLGGDQIVVKATYGSKECSTTLNVQKPNITKAEYAKNTVRRRQEDMAYRLNYRMDMNSTELGSSALSYLPCLYSKMLVYPKETDYSSFINWHVNQTEYEEKIIGRGLDGGDFIMLQMIMMYKQLYGKVNASELSWSKLKEYLLNIDYAKPGDILSENHQMIFYSTALLVAETWQDETIMGKPASEVAVEYKQYLKNWMNTRLKGGMGEYNSAHYLFVDLYGLEILYSYTNDEELKQMAYDMLTYIYADTLNDSIDENLGGAQMRAYVSALTTSRFKAFKVAFNLGTYPIDENYSEMNVQLSHIVNSKYVPIDLLYKQATDANKRYNNKERALVYPIPDNNLITQSIKKYSHVTPEYVMGSVVNIDDLTSAYGLGSSIRAGQQEIPWSVTLGGSNDAIIFDSHPGPQGIASGKLEHGFFAGDYGCMCYQYFQEDNVSLGMHKITGVNELKYTHFWLPKSAFETITEEDGWIFIKQSNVYVALKPLKDGVVNNTSQYVWGDSTSTFAGLSLSDVEVKINSANTAFVCETADSTEFSGSFDSFKTAIKSKVINYVIDSNNYYIEYTGLNGKTLKLNYNSNERFINNTKIDFTTYNMHDCPYMQANWQTGNIVLSYGNDQYTITQF